MEGNGRGWRASLTRFLARGAEEEPYRPPEKRTWAEKVTDDANAWLGARRLEAEGDLGGAAAAYARDAALWSKRRHDARAALSLACQARCLAALRNDGVEAYGRAGDLYVTAARGALRTDPHTSLQLFLRARECYGLAGDGAKASEAGALAASLRGALEPPRAR